MDSVRRQSGLSLVELMIAMLLSLLLMLGVMQLFLSSHKSYIASTALSRLQDSARLAMDYIGYDLRNAGYRGECLASVNAPVALGGDERFDLNVAIKGWEAEEKLPDWPRSLRTEKIEGTDSILIKHAALSAGVHADVDIPETAMRIAMTQVHDEAADSNIVLSSILGCDLFRSGAVSKTSIAKVNEEPLSRSYKPEITRLLIAQGNQYYLRKGADGLPSLWRKRWKSELHGYSEELVEGIHDLKFDYGIGQGSGEYRAVGSGDFVGASSVRNWNDVVAVRVRLLVLGSEINVTEDDQVYDRSKGLVCGKGERACSSADSIEIPQRRLARAFTSTVSLRNRLP